jgi:hypothetical protein
MKFSWYIFKGSRGKGRCTPHNHILNQDNKSTLCGQIKLELYELAFIIFKKENEIFEGTKCQRCIQIAKMIKVTVS